MVTVVVQTILVIFPVLKCLVSSKFPRMNWIWTQTRPPSLGYTFKSVLTQLDLLHANRHTLASIYAWKKGVNVRFARIEQNYSESICDPKTRMEIQSCQWPLKEQQSDNSTSKDTTPRSTKDWLCFPPPRSWAPRPPLPTADSAKTCTETNKAHIYKKEIRMSND